ncbi:MAG TPA: type II secretion system F family protein [Tepidisphaeraceae bacterium]|jgi:type IV pilus assembly protein PilC|nr:type II secretion system F family protein [Tepidisphaeraceae bacterium]
MNSASRAPLAAPAPPRAPGDRSVLHALAASLFWCFAAVVILVLLGGALYFTIPMMLVVAPLLALLLLASAAEAVRYVRRQRSMAILSYLDQAVRLNLPLPAMLASAARSERGVTRRRLRDLRAMVEQGHPISNSLRHTTPEMPDRAVALIRAGEATGAVAPALQRLLRENGRAMLPDPLNVAFYRIYPLALALMITLVLTMLMIFVMPKYEQIFLDFKISFPPITLLVLSFSRDILFPLTFLLAVVALLVAGRAAERFFVVRSGFHGVFRGLTDRVTWFIPLAGAAARDRGLADTFATLGDAVRSGRPLPRAVEEAGRIDVNAVLAAKLSRWRRELEAGASMADAARLAGLPRLVVGLLATAHGSNGALVVCDFLSRYYGSKYSRSRALIVGAYVPAVTLVLGVCVAAVALAMLVPLTRMADQVSIGFGG